MSIGIFGPYNTVSLNGGRITARTVESIVLTANHYGSVQLIDVGPTSVIDLLLELLAEAQKTKEEVCRHITAS